MKCKRLLLLLLLAIGLPWAANAQDRTIKEIGTGTSKTNVAPIGNYYNYSFSQQLYTASEIGTAGTINSISFHYGLTTAKDFPIHVYMKNVTNTDLTGGFVNLAETDKVFDGTLSVSGDAWVTINLDTPFSYDGTSNLLIAVDKDYVYYFSGDAWYYTSATGMTRYYNNDSTDPNPLSPPAGTITANRPNIRIDISIPAGLCIRPSDLTCTEYSANTANLEWTPGNDETAWVLQYSTDNTFATSVQSVNVSNTPNTQLTGLTSETKYYARVRPDCDENLWSNTCEFKPSAVQIVTIGSGTDNNNYLPAYTLYNNSLSEQIYTAAEVGMAGTINSLAFYNGGTTKTPNLKIYLVHTDVTEFSSATAWLTVTATDLVFEGDVELTANQWTTIEFNNEFDYDGSSNLGLIVDEHMTYSSGLSCRVFTSTDNCSMYVYNDDTDYNAVGASYNNGVRAAVKNQIQLGILASNTPKPRNLVVSNITTEGATVTWEAPADNVTGYQYQYKYATTPNWPDTWNSLAANVTTKDLTLQAGTLYDFRVRANYAEGDSDPAEIQFTTEATCLVPEGLAVNDMVATWTAGTATQWNLQYKKSSDATWTSDPGLTATTYDFNDLTLDANTDYDVQVQADCGNGDLSDWTETVTFRTPCGAITSFPITYGFETSEGFPSNASEPTTNQLGNCWNTVAMDNNGNYATRVWGTSTSYKHGGSQALVLPDKGNSTNFSQTMLVFPEMNFTSANGYKLSFWIYRNSSSSTPEEGFKVFISDTEGISENAVELGHYSRNYNQPYPVAESASGWYKYEIEIPQATMTGNVFLIFMGQSYYGNATYVDDITIKENIPLPTQIVAANPAAGQMTWSEFANYVNVGGEDFMGKTITLQDDINITEMVGTAENPFSGTFDGNNRTITANLTATENYCAPFRYVRNATIQNLTVGGTIETANQYAGGFVGDCFGNNTLTNCLSNVTINSTKSGDGTHGGFIARNSGGGTVNLTGCAFTGRLLGTETTNCAGLVGWTENGQYGTSSHTIFTNCVFAPAEVTIGTSGSYTFSRIYSSSNTPVTVTNSYYTQTFGTAQGKLKYNITAETGITVTLSGEPTEYDMSGITAYASNYGLLYNDGIIAGDGETVSLILNGAAGYQANHGTLVPNGDVFTLTMEASDTEISAVDCPEPYNVAVPAATLAARSAQVTWNGGSESYTVQYREVITAAVDVNDTYGFEDGTQGWTTIDADGHGNAWSRYNGNANNGSYSMKATYNGSYAHQDYLVSPQITLGGSLSFYAKKGGSYTDTFRVYLSTNGNTSASDFTIELTDGNVDPTNSYTQYTYDLSDYTGMGYVAIVYTAAANQLSLYVDDITITNHIDGEYGEWHTVNATASPKALEDLTPETSYQVKVSGTCAGVPTDYSDVVEFTTLATCPAPTELAVTDGSVTAHAATITWTENGEATTWIVEYAGNADFTGALTETVEDNATYSFDDLDGETTYYVRVKAHCGDEDESDYSNVVNFTTLVACPVPTVLTVTATTTTTATLSWTENGTATAWQICLNGDETNLIDADSNPFALENLTAATSYTVKVRANCGGIDGESAWSNEVSFTTHCDVITVDLTHSFTEGFEGTTFAPICWESIASGTHAWIRNTDYHHGEGSANAYSGYYGDIYLIMPDIQISSEVGGAQLSFWSFNRYVSDYDKNSVVLIDGENETELWSPESVSQSWVETTIDLSSYVGQTISLAFKYEGDNAHGWYIDDVKVEVLPFTKTIAAVGEENWEGGKGGYYFIASPLAEDVTPNAANGFITDNYDLYYFSQTGDNEGNEWINYKPNGAFDLTNGKGYLYASKEGTTLTFTGAPSTNGTVTLDDYNANARFKGWNLIGNPLAQDAYINKPFYTLENSDTYTSNEAVTAIHAMQGVLIIADENEKTVTFSTEAPAAKNSKLNMNLRRDNKQLDNAILVFGGEQQLGKMTFRENSSKIFMPVEGKDYAITSVEGQVGEVPVSFKAENNGTYSLSFTSEEVTFSYLHLIDNMTGNDVNLLQTPSYTFDARTTDYASRFKLVFAVGSSANDETFGFVNASGNFCIFGIEGEATVQVIDVLGHVLSSETFSGSYEKRINGAPGVYMVRLIQGNDVKVQKVVVR